VTRCGAQQNRTGQIGLGQFRCDPRLENDEQKEVGDRIHGERLDQPVSRPRDIKAFGIFPMYLTLAKSTFIIMG